MWSPWSVFQYGANLFAYFSCTFTLPKPNASFSTFARATLFSIGLSLYLAFDAHAAVRTALPSSTTHLIGGLISGAITHSSTAFHQFITFLLATLFRAYHLSFSLFSRPYYGNPCLFLFLPLVICLSSGRILTQQCTIRVPLLRNDFRILYARHRIESLVIPYRSLLLPDISSVFLSVEHQIFQSHTVVRTTFSNYSSAARILRFGRN